MTKPPDKCHDFDVKSARCKACDSWGECALRHPLQFKHPEHDKKRGGRK